MVKTILLCGKQNFALRGHRDDSQHIDNSRVDNVGNFQALLDFRIDSGDVILNEHFQDCAKNATYRSKSVQNEIINIIGDLLREKNVKDVEKVGSGLQFLQMKSVMCLTKNSWLFAFDL